MTIREVLVTTEMLTSSGEYTDMDEIVIALGNRSRFYRTLSKLYYSPFSQEELDAIDSADLRDLAKNEGNPSMAEGFNDMYRYLRRRNTGTREDLNADFTRCFMGSATYKGLTCMPYASLFLSSDALLMGTPRKEVHQIYKQQCIKLEEGIDLPEDHLSFECEFMAIVGERSAQELECGKTDKAIEQLLLQKDFLEKHILSWVSRFFNLSVELTRTRFYQGVVKMTKGFLSDEPDTIDFLISELDALDAASTK